MLTRRQFLAGSCALAGAATLPACGRASAGAGRNFTGGMLGPSVAAGHRLRSGTFPPPSETLDVENVVIGGGIAGLAAARQLQRTGARDFVLLELEAAVGGNAQSGRNAVSAYPWGAHYLPLPGDDAVEIRSLLEELQLITGYDAEGVPLYDEYALCADPMERLFVNGTWQEGLVPRLDVSSHDRAEIDAFLGQMDSFRKARGTDGRRAFAIPVDRSSRDAEFQRLDELTMSTYLDVQGWWSEPLRWYVDYCCRDDYGAGSDQISAWAGIHYFASRNGRAGNASPSSVLTWPEGNGWLVRKLAEPLRAQTRSQALVWKIEAPSEGGVIVNYFDLVRERTVRVTARGAICALPRFVVEKVLHGNPGHSAAASVVYSPWLVANLTLAGLPIGPGEPLAWDNVLRKGRSLGYVVATHQNLSSHPRETVITFYQPLDDLPPAAARQAALDRSYEFWCKQIFSELERAHPELPSLVRHLDVWLWGHAMVRPVPGFIWGETRARIQAPLERIVFAHSDLSGISIFEEAYVRGTQAANVLVAKLRDKTSA